MLLFATAIAFGVTSGASAQSAASGTANADTLQALESPPIVVTATRTEKALEDVSVPITVVTADEMGRQGVLRLQDALKNVPGLMLADDHGIGLQIRGLDADYTLVLLDGEPVIGRTAGTLDLDHLAVQGLSHIEVVRGPSSSLFGSEALAGVVNLVSARPPPGTRGSISLRTGTHATTNLSGLLSMGHRRGGVRIKLGRYSSSGYDLTPNTFGSSAPAFANYETDVRANLTVSDRLKLRLGLRAASEEHSSAFADRSDDRYVDEGDRLELSVHPEAIFKLSRRLQLTTTLYGATFGTSTRHFRQVDKVTAYEDDFDQYFLKAENQLDAFWNGTHLTTLGAGFIQEAVGGSRYGARSPAASDQVFGYAQHQWLPSHSVQLTASARFDWHSDYSARLTPKVALLVRPMESVRLRASVASGFKAPALRQLYLSYTNAAAGYSVFGATQLEAGIRRLSEAGHLDELFLDPASLGPIGAEHSVAYNVGTTIRLGTRLSLSADVFHNRVRDLIETRPIARKTNGQFVYGYFNLARMYTRGVEVSVNATSDWIDVAGSYQFLQARDLAVVRALNEGTVYGRLPNGHEYRLGLSDYTGLFGRSPHAAALRATFSPERFGLVADVRLRWRSQYGLRDYDGNQIANRPDEFVAAHFMADATVTKPISLLGFADLSLQAGVSNAFDHTDPSSMPSVAGRTMFVALLVSL